MKNRLLLPVNLLIALLLFPKGPLYGQAPAKPPLPQVPITYPGDNEETIKRRAKWIEGARKEGALEWWGSGSPSLHNQIIAEFNKSYPFIKVNYRRGTGEETAARLEAEFATGRISVDITLGAETSNYPRWRKMGVMEKFTDLIPGIKTIGKGMYSKYGDSFIAGSSISTPQYNAKLLPQAEAPKRWEDLLDSKWKGQIGLTADMKPWVTLALAEGGWGIERTEEFLRKIKQQQPVWGAGHSTAHALLVAGEFKIFGEGYIHHVLQSHKKGAPVEWCRVSPVVVTGSSFTLQKKAPHPNAARLFLEWFFSPHVSVFYEELTGKGAPYPGSGTKMAKALEGLSLAVRTDDIIITAAEQRLEERLAAVLGVTPAKEE